MKKINRRSFLKALGTAAGAAALTGLTGCGGKTSAGTDRKSVV